MKRILFSAATLMAVTVPAHALLLSFDSGSTTEGTGRPVTAAFTVTSSYLETEDEFGDPLPVPAWTPIEPAKIGNPDAPGVGYGKAISGTGALDAVFDQIVFTFESPVWLSEFSTILDDSRFGTLGDSEIQFLDAADKLLAKIVIDQTQPRLLAQLDGAPVNGVKKILLPAGAFYDDVTLNVPESGPGVALLGLVGLVGAIFARLGARGRAVRSA